MIISGKWILLACGFIATLDAVLTCRKSLDLVITDVLYKYIYICVSVCCYTKSLQVVSNFYALWLYKLTFTGHLTQTKRNHKIPGRQIVKLPPKMEVVLSFHSFCVFGRKISKFVILGTYNSIRFFFFLHLFFFFFNIHNKSWLLIYLIGAGKLKKCSTPFRMVEKMEEKLLSNDARSKYVTKMIKTF